MASWFYMQDGQSVGPVSYERIKQLAEIGILTPNSAVRYEGGEWQEVSEVPGIKYQGSDTNSYSGRSELPPE